MEGGVYPWKRQKGDGVKYCDYEEMLKPLPPPPDGLMWIKTRVYIQNEDEDQQEDALIDVDESHAATAQGGDEGKRAEPCQKRWTTRWELVEKIIVTSGNTIVTQGGEGSTEPIADAEEEIADFIEHTVLPTDTLAGIRLRYKVTVTELRKYNNFCGEQFQLCETLRIPVHGREEHIQKFRQKPTKDVIRQRFKNATRCDDYEMATYYLENNEYELAAAVAEYEEDKLWEESHRARQTVRIPIATTAPFAPAMISPAPSTTGPPPSYASVFKISNSSSNQGGSTSPSHSSKSSKKTYYPWSLSPFTKRRQEVQAYDMSDVVSADENVEDVRGGARTTPYRAMFSGEREERAVAVASVVPVGEEEDGMDQLRTPLLSRSGGGSGQ